MDVSKLQQMVQSGNVVWDVAETGLDLDLTEANDEFVTLDTTIVPVADFTGNWPATAKGVPFFIYSTVLSYNTDALATAPTGWRDFFDTAAFPGKRALLDTEAFRGILEIALLVDGVSRDALYPLDVERGLTLLEPLKSDLVYFQSGADGVDLVSTGEAVMGACYNGRVATALQDGQPIDMIWDKQVQSADYLSIPKGSPNADAAQKLIAYIVSPEHNGELSNYLAYAPANPGASGNPDVTKYLATENELTGDAAPIVPDNDWWIENRESTLQRVAEWQAS